MAQTKNIIASIMIIALLILPMAAAELQVTKTTNEFSASTPVLDTKTCACSTFQIPLTVNNVGDVEGVFDIDIETSVNWFKVPEESFPLQAGETRTVMIFADVPCGYAGVTEYEIVITSTYGREKRVPRTLEVVQCQNLMLRPGQTTQTVDPAEVGRFSFTVANSAPFTDTYTVSVGKNAQNIELSETEFQLEAGEEKEIFAYARMSPDKWGEFVFPITVGTSNNAASESLDLHLRVRKNYGFVLAATAPDAPVCMEQGADVPFTIRNTGAVDNTYTLSTPTESASLSEARVALEPREEKEVTVSLDAGSPGRYDVTVEAHAAIGGASSEASTTVEVQDCFAQEVEVSDLNAGCEPVNKTITIRNTGTQRQTFQLALDGPAWAELTQDSVTLEPGEEAKVTLMLNPPCTDKTEELRITASGRDEVSASFTVSIETPETQFRLRLAQQNYEIGYGQEFLDVTFMHEGSAMARYNLTVDSDFLTPEDNTFTLQPGERENVRFAIGDLSELPPGEYLHDLGLSVVGTDIVYQTTIGTNLVGPGPLERFGSWLYWVFIGSNWYARIGLCGWVAVLLVLAIAAGIVIAVLARRGKMKGFSKAQKDNVKRWSYIAGALAVLAFMLFIAIFDSDPDVFYDQPSERAGPLFHEFRQGERYTIQIGDYFTDPDEDELTFSYERGKSLETVSITGGTARISAVEEFRGEDTITFIATDEAGAVTKSPEMTIRVLGRKDVSTVDWWLANCWAWNSLLLAFVLAVLVGVLLQLMPKETVRYQKKKKASKKTRRKKK